MYARSKLIAASLMILSLVLSVTGCGTLFSTPAEILATSTTVPAASSPTPFQPSTRMCDMSYYGFSYIQQAGTTKTWTLASGQQFTVELGSDCSVKSLNESAPVSTVTVTNTATAATAGPNTSVAEGVADVRGVTEQFEVNGWHITMYDGATPQMLQWAKDLKAPVSNWELFPNEDWPNEGFSAADGLEYGMAESAYCQQDQKCDVNVPAKSYRLVTGDYVIPNVDDCRKAQVAQLIGTSNYGCAFMGIEVSGEETTMIRNSTVDFGFTVSGLFFNGNKMSTTIHALASNTAFNMNNNGSTMGPIKWPANRGANCSIALGCDGIRFTFAVFSGNHLLMTGWVFIEDGQI